MASLAGWSIVGSGESAWRALYLGRGDPRGSWKQVAAVGFDPRGTAGPNVFFALSVGRFYRSGYRTLPHLRWRSGASDLYVRAYQFQQRLLHRLDGRYRRGPT